MKNVTIKLTGEQQKQIKDATGKDLTELNIDLPATDAISEKGLEEVSGGVVRAGGDKLKYL